MAKGKRKGTNQESPPLYPEVKDAPKDTGSMIDGRRSSPPGRRSSWYNRRLFFNPRRRSRPYTPGSVHPASASRAFPALRSKRPPHSGGGVPGPARPSVRGEGVRRLAKRPRRGLSWCAVEGVRGRGGVRRSLPGRAVIPCTRVGAQAGRRRRSDGRRKPVWVHAGG